MRRVSSTVRIRAAPAGVSFPSISTSGGLPGVKKRSLIFAAVFSIATNSAGVENGAGAGAAAVAAAVAGRGAGGATFGGPVVEEDIIEEERP